MENRNYTDFERDLNACRMDVSKINDEYAGIIKSVSFQYDWWL